MKKLSKSMTSTQFKNGYWYAHELRQLAKEIGIPRTSKLRKDQLEQLIAKFLESGRIDTVKKTIDSKRGLKDHEIGLSLQLPIVNYTNNKVTKDFIEVEALKKSPNLKKKSGVSYRLNRWREEQIEKGHKITYHDLINEYIRLNQSQLGFERIPHARYINFISDYLKYENEATRKRAIKAWKKLKTLTIPKDYLSWKNYEQKRQQ